MNAPRPRVVSTSAALATEIDRLRRQAPTAIGVLPYVTDVPRSELDDPRRGTVNAIAIATEPQAPKSDTADVLVVLPEAGRDLAWLWRWWSEPGAPYVVFHDAHAALFRLGEWDPALDGHPPHRSGSVQIAAILLAEGSRDARSPPRLDECVTKLLQETLPEPALDSLSGRDPEGLRFLAAAAATLPRMMRAVTPMLRQRELTAIHALENRLLPAIIAMERIGMGVDAAAFERTATTWQTERKTAEDPARIARLDKLLSTYAYWPREYVHGNRIRCHLRPLATDSGRFSCVEPNLQQVPSEHTAPGLRACFQAAPGYRLIIADYAQIELRVAAALAPCAALRQVFLDGRDPHRATAAAITGKPEAAITDHERKLAKAVNFGFLFGMGAPRFRAYAADGYGIDLDEHAARKARETFLAAYPGIARWHRNVGRIDRQSDMGVVVRTLLGRRKRFERGKFSFTSALNIPVQGTAADGFKQAMVDLHDRLVPLGGRGVLCVHDEYVAEVPEHIAQHGLTLVETAMVEAMQRAVPGVPIAVVARVADCWS